MKRFLSTFLAVSMALSINMTTVFANEQVEEQELEIITNNNDIEVSQLETNITRDDIAKEFDVNDIEVKIKEKITVENTVNTDEKNTRVAGHHTANDAYYLDSNNLNVTLSDTADSNQNWYYFQMDPTEKVSVFLGNTNTGDYDLYLYRYNSDGSLTLVALSEYVNSSEQLSYVGSASDTGYYWLLINPYIPANPVDSYDFRIDTIASFDNHEPNDYYQDATHFTNKINTNGSIDNPLDIDFYTLTLPSTGEYSISLNSVPAGNEYRVQVYDENFTYKGSITSTDNQTAYVSGVANKKYYFKVLSTNGTYNNSENYSLKVFRDYGGALWTTPNNNIIEIVNEKDLYIDGTRVNLYWDYHYTTNYTRTEELTLNPGYNLGLSLKVYYRDGYAQGDSVKSDNAILIQINDAYMYSYYNNTNPNIGEPVQYYSEFIDAPQFYVDVNNPHLMDFNESTFYYISGKPTTTISIGDLEN